MNLPQSDQFNRNQSSLNELMQRSSITNLEDLSEVANVPELQIRRLLYGLVYKLSVENSLKLAQVLQIDLQKFITLFAEPENADLPTEKITSQSNQEDSQNNRSWQQEYQRLKQEITEQQKTLQVQFQQDSLQVIESWLIQWPTAIAAIAKNPDLPAERLIPLVNPVKELVTNWGLTAIESVGEELAYNPQFHELMSGIAEPGAMVKVRYVGYKKGNEILYKAKVSPLEES